VGAVGRLLELNDVNPDGASKSGRTPLFRAMDRREGVFKLLLGEKISNTIASVTPAEYRSS